MWERNVNPMLSWVSILLLILFTGCERHHGTVIYEIPDGYKGHVVIQYECKGGSRKQGNVLTIRINGEGLGCVEDKIEYGWYKGKYFYVKPGADAVQIAGVGVKMDDKGVLWGAGIGRLDNKPPSYEHFFIGTHDEFLKDVDGWWKKVEKS